jgi:hypothetical protein
MDSARGGSLIWFSSLGKQLWRVRRYVQTQRFQHTSQDRLPTGHRTPTRVLLVHSVLRLGRAAQDSFCFVVRAGTGWMTPFG